MIEVYTAPLIFLCAKCDSIMSSLKAGRRVWAITCYNKQCEQYEKTCKYESPLRVFEESTAP